MRASWVTSSKPRKSMRRAAPSVAVSTTRWREFRQLPRQGAEITDSRWRRVGTVRVGYMPDQFGHAAQVPQLLRLFAIDGAVLWRGVGPERPPHAFRWQAPDGSAVSALWLQDGYASGRRIPSDPAGFVAA